MVTELVISADHLETLSSHAMALMPYEAPALLFGRLENDRAIVTRVETVENALKSTTAFEIDAEREYRLIEDAEKRQEEIIGIFHSHPTQPEPSVRDLENMRLNPVAWLIAAFREGEWRMAAFAYQNGHAVRLKMTVIPGDILTKS